MPVHDLIGFHGHLQQCNLRPASIAQVTYRVSQALDAMTDMADAHQLAEYHLSLPPASRGNFRSSWRKWASFARNVLGADVADAPEVPVGRTPKDMKMPLPEAVQAAVVVLMREVPALALSSMRWGDVRTIEGQTYLRSVLDAKVRRNPELSRTYPALSTAATAALISLRSWAVPANVSPEVADQLPLVPMSPGSAIPASGGLLRTVEVSR